MAPNKLSRGVQLQLRATAPTAAPAVQPPIAAAEAAEIAARRTATAKRGATERFKWACGSRQCVPGGRGLSAVRASKTTPPPPTRGDEAPGRWRPGCACQSHRTQGHRWRPRSGACRRQTGGASPYCGDAQLLEGGVARRAGQDNGSPVRFN
eukprot:scaffold10240_cov107-Isochrysis_galbana.AAC.5